MKRKISGMQKIYIYFGTMYTLCAIYLNIIEIYLYLNKIQSSAYYS